MRNKMGKLGKDILRNGILGRMGKIIFERFWPFFSIFDQKGVEFFRFWTKMGEKIIHKSYPHSKSRKRAFARFSGIFYADLHWKTLILGGDYWQDQRDYGRIDRIRLNRQEGKD